MNFIAVHMGFATDEVVLGQGFLRVLRSPSNPPQKIYSSIIDTL